MNALIFMSALLGQVDTSSAAGSSGSPKLPTPTEALPGSEIQKEERIVFAESRWRLGFEGVSLVGHRGSSTLLSEAGVFGGIEVFGGRALLEDLAIEVSFGTLGSASEVQDADLSISVLGLRAGLVQFLELNETFVAFGRVSLTGDLGELSVTTPNRRVDLADTAFSVGLRANVGIEARFPVGGSDDDASLGVSVRAGYRLVSAFAFDGLEPDIDGDPDPKRLEGKPIDLGGLSLSGVELGLGLGARF